MSIVDGILQPIFDKIKTERHTEITKSDHKFYGKLRWKSPEKYTMNQITNVSNMLNSGNLGKKIYHKEFKDYTCTFDLNVFLFANKTVFSIDTNWKCQIELTSFTVIYYTISQQLFVDVDYTVKIYDDSLVVVNVTENITKLETLDLYELLQKNMYPWINNTMLTKPKNYDFKDNYKWYDDSNTEISHGKIKEVNYYSHNDKIYTLKSKNGEICKTLKLRVSLNIKPKRNIKITEPHELNYDKSIQIDIPILLESSNSKQIDINKYLKERIDDGLPKETTYQGIFYNHVDKKKQIDYKTTERYQINTYPLFGGVVENIPQVSKTAKILDMNGNLELYYVYNFLNNVVYNNCWDHFIKEVIDKLPLVGLFLGVDDTLFRIIGEETTEHIKRDLILLKSNAAKERQANEKYTSVFAKMEKTWEFIMSLQSKPLSKHIITSFFTTAETRKVMFNSNITNGTYVSLWSGITKSKTIQDKEDYMYFYCINAIKPSNYNEFTSNYTMNVDTSESNQLVLCVKSKNYKFKKLQTSIKKTNIEFTSIPAKNNDNSFIIQTTVEINGTYLCKVEVDMFEVYIIQLAPTYYEKWEDVSFEIKDSIRLQYLPQTLYYTFNDKKFSWKIIFNTNKQIIKEIDGDGIYYVQDKKDPVYNTNKYSQYLVKMKYLDLNTLKEYNIYSKRIMAESSWREGNTELFGIYSYTNKGKQPYSIYKNGNFTVYGNNNLPIIVDWYRFIHQDYLYIGTCTKELLELSKKAHKEILESFDQLANKYEHLEKSQDKSDIIRVIMILEKMFENQDYFNNINGMTDNNTVYATKNKVISLLSGVVKLTNKNSTYEYNGRVLELF